MRLHPEGYHLLEYLEKNNFKVVEIGKISYEEFKTGCEKELNKAEMSFPSKYLEFAHKNYNCLAESILYIGEAFRMFIEEEREPSLVDVKQSVEQKYIWFKLKNKRNKRK
ncbi:hypothetical protein HYU21_03985 [Candidatus Woesearchaeota archaeon]|nr:hypothetical protein [Candidatus Woesearchaeota archaeon]